MVIEFRLELDGKGGDAGIAARNAFFAFQKFIAATEAALLKAQQAYGPDAYVELEFNKSKAFQVECWIWKKVIGSKVILGRGETWEQAFEDAAEKTREPAEDDFEPPTVGNEVV